MNYIKCFDTLDSRIRSKLVKAPIIDINDGDGFKTELPKHIVNSSESKVFCRFAFIDAPELEQKGGLESKKFLEYLLRDFKSLFLLPILKTDTNKITDRYNRLICIPFAPLSSEELAETSPVDSDEFWYRNIEKEMLRNGYAWCLRHYEPDIDYIEAEEKAILEKLGIWKYENNIHPWEFKRKKHRKDK